MTVAAILNLKGRDVYTEAGDRTLRQICSTLGERGIGAIIIASGKSKIEGIISERDVVRALARQGDGVLDKPVGEFMTKKVVTCTENDTVNEVMEKMTAGRFRHVPVVKDGALCGLISIGDVVKHRIAQIEREAEEMRNYIAMS